MCSYFVTMNMLKCNIENCVCVGFLNFFFLFSSEGFAVLLPFFFFLKADINISLNFKVVMAPYFFL